MVLGRSARHRGPSRAAERSPQLALVASVDLDGVVRSGAAVVLADAAGVIRHHARIGDQATVPMTQLERQRIGMPVSGLVIGTDRTVVEDEVLAQAIVVAAIAGTFQHPGASTDRRSQRSRRGPAAGRSRSRRAPGWRRQRRGRACRRAARQAAAGTRPSRDRGAARTRPTSGRAPTRRPRPAP